MECSHRSSECFILSKWRKDIRSFNQEVNPGGVGLFQCNNMQRLAMRYLVNLPSTGDTLKIAIKGHGAKGVSRTSERVSKTLVQKEPSFGHKKKVCVWSTGEREHLIQESCILGNRTVVKREEHYKYYLAVLKKTLYFLTESSQIVQEKMSSEFLQSCALESI